MESDMNVTVMSSNHGFRGFFSSKASRKLQRLKEKVGITHKLEDKEYEKLQKSLKKNCDLMKKPISHLQRYVDAVREVAFSYGSLCRVLRSFLADGADEEQVSRLTEIQHEMHVICVSFLDTLGELDIWIRCKQIQEAEKNFENVQHTVEYCRERRLDSVVVSKIAKHQANKSVGATFVNPVYSNNGYLDSTLANKTFPSFNTPARVLSVQNQAARLYNDAKQSAIDAINDAMETNSASQLCALSTLQPAETDYEVKTARSRKLLVVILLELAQDSPLFDKEQHFDFKEIRKSWIKLTKTLCRYSESVSHYFRAKADFHHSVITTMKGEASLDWFPDATRRAPMLAVNQLRDVSMMLQRTREKLECAQVIQDLSRSYSEQAAAADDLKHDVQGILVDSFTYIMQAEDEIKLQAKELGKRWKAQSQALDVTVSHTDPISQSF